MSSPNTPSPDGYPDYRPEGRGRLWLRLGAAGLVLALLALFAYSVWKSEQGYEMSFLRSYPPRVMGTRTEIVATAWTELHGQMPLAISRAERALRSVEVEMSTYLSASDITRLNMAEVGADVELSPRTRQVLRMSMDLTSRTRGAFDPTCRPILLLWSKSAKAGREPTRREIDEALKRTGWDKIQLTGTGAKKTAPSDGVALGGIAKGFGIDLAIEAMQTTEASGGMVNVGGDVRCYGRNVGNEPWPVTVQDPFNPTTNTADGLCQLKLRDGAVCTSGNYFRNYKIGDRHFSHIVNPTTGMPADAVPSVTVIAPTAALADALATAMSVLGEDGKDIIESMDGVEALWVIGTASDPRIVLSSGFAAYVDGPIKYADGGLAETHTVQTQPVKDREARTQPVKGR